MADTKLSALAAATLGDTDEIYINDGGTSKKATIAELRTALNPKGFIALDFSSLRELVAGDIPDQALIAGGALGADTNPIYERSNDATDKSLRLNYILSSANDEVQFAPVPMPPDLDETIDVTIHVVAAMTGGTDAANTIDIEVWDAVGDTEMGGVTGVLTGTPAELTVTIGNADISGHPTGFFNISFTPQGTHTTDGMLIYCAWIEYTRKLPA